MPPEKKQRLDNILVQRGFFSSRSQAAAAVLAGEVSVGGKPVTKAGALTAPDAEISLKEEPRFVSRGGLKLQCAFERFDLNVAGKVVLDAGASTGGFTDCLLSHGAGKVIAVDVSYGQLDWKLRQDTRVEVLERTNIRYLKKEMLSEAPALATFDLSFISLKKVLAAVIKCLEPGFELVILIKPQFEAGKSSVGSGGVVRDLEVRRQVLADIWDFAEARELKVLGLIESCVRGPKGNIEYLMHLRDSCREGPDSDAAARRDEAIARIFLQGDSPGN